MRTVLPVALALLSLLASCVTTFSPSTHATVGAHVAKEKSLAGDDLKDVVPVCAPQPAERPSAATIEGLLRRIIAARPPEPGQAFDNLFFVVSSFVSAWVNRTSQGLIIAPEKLHDAPSPCSTAGFGSCGEGYIR